jgi:hypothetical protein
VSKKRLTVNSAVAVLISLSDHLVNLVVSQLLANRSHDVAELSGRDKTVVVAVKDLECLSDLLLGIRVLHLASHHGQEFCEGISFVAANGELVGGWTNQESQWCRCCRRRPR